MFTFFIPEHRLVWRTFVSFYSWTAPLIYLSYSCLITCFHWTKKHENFKGSSRCSQTYRRNESMRITGYRAAHCIRFCCTHTFTRADLRPKSLFVSGETLSNITINNINIIIVFASWCHWSEHELKSVQSTQSRYLTHKLYKHFILPNNITPVYYNEIYINVKYIKL